MLLLVEISSGVERETNGEYLPFPGKGRRGPFVFIRKVGRTLSSPLSH